MSDKIDQRIVNCLLLDDNTVLVGLEDIGAILQCSNKYVSKLIKEHGLPAACIDGKYYSVKKLVVDWVIKNAETTRIDSEQVLKNLIKTP